jgi:hypothetical protein
MKRTIATSAVAVALVALGFAAVADIARQPKEATSRLAMDVEVAPVAGKPGQFLLSATLTDLDRNAVLAKPRMTIAAGKAARLRISGKDGWTFEATVNADGAKRKAAYDASFSEGGKVVARQRLSLDLNG